MVLLFIVGGVALFRQKITITRSLRLEGKNATTFGVWLVISAIPLQLLAGTIIGPFVYFATASEVWPRVVAYAIVILYIYVLAAVIKRMHRKPEQPADQPYIQDEIGLISKTTEANADSNGMLE